VLDYTVHFNERFTATSTTTETTLMEDALLSLIDGATTSVDITLYGLNRQSVITALINAHDWGVTVRVVGDDEAATGDYITGYQALADAGITVITDTSTSKIQHNKFLVVDGQIVWTGSTNFTDAGLTLNANNTIVVTDTTLAGIYTAEFEEMWTGKFHEDKADDTAHLLDYNGTLVESHFSPTDLVAFEVWDELANADESIHFGMFFWTDDLLTERVLERLNEGIKVYGVWDALGAASPYSADEALSGAGAQIRVENFAGKVHHKFAVIDVQGSDPTVILGSYNWTDSGAYDNDENTLIIHDYGLAQAYYAEWQRLWSALDEPQAQLTLTKTVSNDTPNPGQLITFTIVVANSGGRDATGALISDTLPNSLTFAGSVIVDPPSTGTTGIPPILVSDMTITTGANITITFPVTVNLDTTGRPLTNTASVACTEVATPVIGSVVITVDDIPIADLSAVNSSPTKLGDATFFTATIAAGTRVTYAWFFGDGGKGTGDTVSHTYNAIGNYTVVVTASNSVSAVTATTVVDVTPAVIYLPLVLRRWPPIPYAPVLNAIDNADGDDNYTVSWTEQPSRLAITYTLQEATDAAFTADLREVCTTEQQSCVVSDKQAGTYYYRVRGHNTWGYGAWSNIQATVAGPMPYNLSAQSIILQLSDMPPGYSLDEEESGPVEFSDEILQMGVADAYEVWYENIGLLFSGTPIVYNLAAVFNTPQGAHDYIQLVRQNADADPEASPISSPTFGDETVAYQAIAADDPVVAYLLVFRKGNLVAAITTGGLQSLAEFDVTVSFANIVLAKINRQIGE
jgi:uncharacterized repeat protein (TIGR01451 family)